MVDEGDGNQILANFKPRVVEYSHCGFPDILALDTENGCHNQMEQKEKQDSQAGYSMKYIQVTFNFVVTCP